MTTFTILQGQGGMDMLPMLLIMAVFFLFMIWPQMRKQKKAKAHLESLGKGNKIVTSGGIHGKIITVADSHFILEVEEGKLRVEKSAVSMELTQAHYPVASESK